MDSTRQPLATPEEVAAYLGIPVATLYQWRYRGVGPQASRVGRHLRYDWRDVEAHVGARRSAGSAA